VERGQNLASVHDPESAEFVTWALIERLGIPDAWIGLSDRATEGTFVWTDGSPLDFERWEPYSPRRHGDETDCVINLPHGWVDIPCDERHVFICAGADADEP
jgi:hypothetical protein